ncbi:hypothetical protein RDI58_000627 [Solanum bulbocastanum]|uniref:Uncharacterized protein n=1 Tax=Solanum bulbocastanum TaxID=147425 RepID=A0AAN8YMH3_SOLBU
MKTSFKFCREILVRSNSMVKSFYLEHLPPNLFAKKSLLSIASVIGKPVAIDKATQERTMPSIARVKSKSNNKEQQQLVPDDNSNEGRDFGKNLGFVRDATIDRAIANSSEEAITFNSNNEENLENKGKSI